VTARCPSRLSERTATAAHWLACDHPAGHDGLHRHECPAQGAWGWTDQQATNRDMQEGRA
jgi:hypothetical protein